MLENVSYFMGKDGFNWFVGVVEDRDDPEHVGRVRVRCLGYHTEDTQNIPVADLPWASVMMPVTAGGNSGIGVSPHFLVEGTWVVGFFRDPAKQEPIILGTLPGNNTVKVDPLATIAASSIVGGFSKKSGGFKDPGDTKPTGGQDVKYPSTLYLGSPDTNLLAQEKGALHEGIIARTTSDSATAWATASGSALTGAAWVPTSAAAKYPYNHVLETEAGHVIEVDDTKDNERIHVYHKTGTYLEIDPKGNIRLDCLKDFTQVVRGNMHTYVVGDQSLTVGGNADLSVIGKVTELITGGRQTTITGAEEIAITGNVKSDIVGTLTESVTLAVKQTYSLTLTTEITTIASIKATGAMTIGGSTISFN